MVVKDSADSKAGMASSTSTQRAPLADMEPAPDTTIPVQQPASTTVDPAKWLQREGTGVVAAAIVPASPTVNPVATPSPTSSTSSVSDGRLSPTKGDSRADRFRLEQRKLLSAIKSDPKLGMPGDEVEGGGSFEGEDTVDSAAVEASVLDEKKMETSVEDSSKSGTVEPDLSVVSGHLTPQLLRKVGVVSPSVATSKDKTVAQEGSKDAGLSQKEGSAVEKEKEAKGQQAECGDAGSKVLGSPARSGIRLGTQTSAHRTDLSATRSALHPTGGKYSALCSSKARPTTTLAAMQRRTNITGLNGSNSPTPTTTSTTSSAPSSPSRSVLSRYPPATSSPPFSSSPRRPISSQAPTSTVLSRSSSGSSAANPRRPASCTGYSSRQNFESSLRSSSTDNSGVRTRRTSGEKGEKKEVGRSSSGVSGGKSGAGSSATTTSKASSSAGSTTTSPPKGSAVSRTASAGARHSTGSVIGTSKTASAAGTTTKTPPTLSGTNTPASKSAVASSVTAATTMAKTTTGTSSTTGATETGAGAVSGGGDSASPAVASPVSEKSVDRKSSERNSQSKPRPARDLSSDRTPRFV